MASTPTLDQFLVSAAQRDPALEQLVPILQGIASAGISLSNLISRYGLSEQVKNTSTECSAGDMQSPLDAMAHNVFEEALRKLPVSFLALEECAELLEIDSAATYGVALDPLDGSSNIETNASIGTIFSVLACSADDLLDQYPGDVQKAAGFLVYGPQTRLVLTCGEGCFSFLLEPDEQKFYQVGDAITLPRKQREFAINTSNYRYWDENVRLLSHHSQDQRDGRDANAITQEWHAP